MTATLTAVKMATLAMRITRLAAGDPCPGRPVHRGTVKTAAIAMAGAPLPAFRAALAAWDGPLCCPVRPIFLLQRGLGTELTKGPSAGIAPASSAFAFPQACPGQHARPYQPPAAYETTTMKFVMYS